MGCFWFFYGVFLSSQTCFKIIRQSSAWVCKIKCSAPKVHTQILKYKRGNRSAEIIIANHKDYSSLMEILTNICYYGYENHITSENILVLWWL